MGLFTGEPMLSAQAEGSARVHGSPSLIERRIDRSIAVPASDASDHFLINWNSRGAIRQQRSDVGVQVPDSHSLTVFGFGSVRRSTILTPAF